MIKRSADLEIILRAIKSAARGLIRDFGEVDNLQTSKKGPNDFVTAADLRAEKTIIEILQQHRPDYDILSEEAGEIKGKGQYRFIIDPLDGTNNFRHGIKNFCISIALEKTIGAGGKPEIIAGVIEAPADGETYWAEKGNGAWLESQQARGIKRLRVSPRDKFAEAMVVLGSLRKRGKEYIGLVDELAGQICATRCFGATALSLAYVAAGRVDGFIDINTKEWDLAAGITLIKEAGGTVTDVKNKNNMLTDHSIIAGNHDIHSKIAKLF